MIRRRRNRRRSPASEVDSLELGLDMVCNAFGGVIFIMMLVAILTNQPVAGSLKMAAPDQIIRRDQLVAEISQARKSIDSLSATLEAITIEDTTAGERASLKREVDDAEASVDDMTSTIDDLRKALEHEQHLISQRSATALLLQQAVDQLRRQLPKPIREERLPELRPVSKSRFFIVLKSDRIYVPCRLVDGQFQNNKDDFDVEEEPHITGRFHPRPGRGQDVKTFVANSLAPFQQRVSHDEFVVYIGLYPDSLASFNTVRNTFTRAGYQYNWFGLSDGQPLVLEPAAERRAASQ